METEEFNLNDEIYDHLNLRVQHSNHSIYHTGSMAMTVDPTSGCDIPLQQSENEENTSNTWRLNDFDFQRQEEGFSKCLMDKPLRVTVNDKTTDQQPYIYSTPCKRIIKKPV